MSHLNRLLIAVGLVSWCLTADVSSAPVPAPTIEGPVTGGLGTPFIAATTFDLSQVGYVEEEFFISGTATAFTNVGPLGSDGTTFDHDNNQISVWDPAGRPGDTRVRGRRRGL